MGKKKGGFLLGFILVVVLLAGAAALFGGYLALVTDPAKSPYPNFLGMAFLPLVLLNVLLFFWALSLRPRASLIPLLAVLSSLFFIGRYWQKGPRDDAAGQDARSLKILSYNLGRLSSWAPGSSLKTYSQCLDSLVAFIAAEDPDIVCLQEYYTPEKQHLDRLIESTFPGYDAEYYMFITEVCSFGNVTLSKYPILAKDKFDFDNSTNHVLTTDLDLDGKRVRVYNCHFESYGLRFTKGDRESSEDLVHDTERKMQKALVRRSAQVSVIEDSVDGCPYESFLVGDFNDPPMSSTYGRLIKGHKDSFVQAGKGFCATFRYMRPLLRIDYVLLPGSFRAVSHKVPHKSFSDHFPVVVEATASAPGDRHAL